MLETIRQYASDKLRESREAEIIRRRHVDYFLALAEQAEPGIRGAQQGVWLNRLELEHDNLRAALRATETSKEVEVGLKLAATLWRFWSVRGHWREGFGWLVQALEMSKGISTSIRAKALHGASAFAQRLGKYDRAQEYAEEKLVLSRSVGDKPSIAGAL